MLSAELVPAALVASALAPAVLFLWLVVIADSRPEPPRVVLGAAFFGALSAVVAAFLELGLQKLIPLASDPWIAAYQNGLLFAGIPEEALKVSIIAILALRARDFDEPMDGVVYGAAVGLGFAALENVGYLAGTGTHWGGLAVIRGVLSVPFHGALGAIAGAYIARVRFGGALGGHAHSPSSRNRLLIKAWLVPMVVHGLFDGALFSIAKAGGGAINTPSGLVVVLLSAVIAPVAGFGAIIYAAVLARRVARHQKAWLHTKRLPVAHWRDVWAACLIGVGVSFVALTLIIAGSSGTRFVGIGILALTVGMAWRSGRHLNATTKRRHGDLIAIAAALPLPSIPTVSPPPPPR
jgi:RsiW-degrading membrane proteinase PrsW (M82 family)